MDTGVSGYTGYYTWLSKNVPTETFGAMFAKSMSNHSLYVMCCTLHVTTAFAYINHSISLFLG
jgi:hypothetical protein